MSQNNKGSSYGLWAGLAVVVVAFFGIVLLSKSSNEPDQYLTAASSLRDAHGLAVDVRDSTKLYIANHSGLYVLQNDKDLYKVGKNGDDYMGFSPHPTDPNILFTSGHPVRGGNLGFQKSTDSGKTWQKVSEGLNGPVDFHSMTVDQADPNIVYGIYRGRMQKSVDGGKGWSYVEAAPSEITQLVSGTTRGIIYAATSDGSSVSLDQGDTWSALSSVLAGGAVGAMAVNPSNEQELLVYSQKAGFSKSADGGKTWSRLNTPFVDDGVRFIAYDKTNAANIYALTGALAIYKTTDSGNSWSKIR